MREWSEWDRMKLKVLIMKNNEKGICEWYEKISIHENSDCGGLQCEGERQKGKHSTASEVYAFVVWMLDASKKLPSRNHWVGIYVHHLTAKYQIILLLILPTFAFRCSGRKISETWSGEKNGKVTKKSFSTPRLSTSGGKFITKRWHIRLCAVGDAKRDKTSLLIWKKKSVIGK